MRFLRPVFLILLFFGHLFNSNGRAQNIPVDTIPFVLNFDHIIIQLSLNGSEPLNFLFDSGAGGTLITKDTADSLGFNASSNRRNIGVSGSHRVGVIKGVELGVGGKKIGNVTLLSTDIPLEEITLFL